MTTDFVVIAANGIQGRIVSRMLLEDGHSVLLAANDDYKMDKLIEYPSADFTLIDLKRMDRVKRVVKKSNAGVIVNCAVDDFNLGVTKMALELGKHYVDLGSEKDMLYAQLALDKDFKEKDLTAITGMGSTPGITNVMLRYVRSRFDTIHTVHVGFSWDSNQSVFVTPFSMDAIAYEFSEPAELLEEGEFRHRQPDEATVSYYYKSIGKQKTRYTKHIEHHSFYEYLKDAGIQNIAVFSSFPSHSYNALRTLVDLGFTSKEPIQIEGALIKPLDFTTEVVRRISVPEGYTEKENLWLKVFGKKGNKDVTAEMDVVAGTLPGWEDATCNIDTGFPAAITAEMIFDGRLADRGLFSPEFIMSHEPFFSELGKRKIAIYDNGKKIN
ncbi:MAG: hypothetical protein A3C92_02765 [Candidatus Sungbacteria bacterium RIFCSPHIGHO2_02_FULL_53_17]|uniref:Saccharopine dehydrogenase NADP binding domain-containing protein n=1 Tax=Candidatus Sungbacteria bacterium RIFCSPHIGHO2_02_FULL_53_17 TaxID=1802275 RepID=A0A1G2KU32_9BACT|nr:MAG: hypothetical protein A3C92_02765 [Candidatus Sungbacteria bacterium RIFCSPHIGHO2_02_FULL_53_17]